MSLAIICRVYILLPASSQPRTLTFAMLASPQILLQIVDSCRYVANTISHPLWPCSCTFALTNQISFTLDNMFQSMLTIPCCSTLNISRCSTLNNCRPSMHHLPISKVTSVATITLADIVWEMHLTGPSDAARRSCCRRHGRQRLAVQRLRRGCELGNGMDRLYSASVDTKQ